MTFAQVDESNAAACDVDAGGPRADGPGPTITNARNNIVLHYDRPEIRARAQSDLATMFAAGATVLRVHVWYRHGEDNMMSNRIARVGDPLGLAVAVHGRLDATVIGNLLHYLADARRLGYIRAVVVVSPEGDANPKCRRQVWGGCYEPGLFAWSWSVVEQVSAALGGTPQAGFDISVDISPEGCFDPATNTLVERNIAQFTTAMLGAYMRRFHDSRWIVSCAGASMARVLPELAGLGDLYDEVGARPAAIDVHVYEKDPAKIAPILLAGNRLAGRFGVPLDINESYYDNAALFATIAQMAPRSVLARLRGLMIFPRRMTSRCQIDVTAPYDMAGIARALGPAAPASCSGSR